MASNDCAIDHLHKDHCAQAFGRNTLSKPHSSWGSQLHTAIIAVWQFILIIGQYIVHSGSIECLLESDSEGMSHAFWHYLLVPQPEIYIK